MKNVESPDVVVIGAGLSGLCAARDLLAQGLEPLLLEARDRPGGRTHAVEVSGVTVDLGGEWVDEAHTELRELVAELDLELIPSSFSKEHARWYVGGEFSSEMPLEGNDAKVHDLMNEALVKTAEATDPECPWKNNPEHDVSVKEWLRKAGMSKRGIHAVETLVSSCGSTVPLDRMSFYSYAVKVATRGGPGKGNEYRVAGGAGRVAEVLAEDLDGRVRYSSPVTEVRQDGSGVEVRWMSRSGPMSAKARRAVIAIPFASYRGIRFDPEPSPVFRSAILNSTYGVVRKIAFVFDEKVDHPSFTVTDTSLGYLSAARTFGERSVIVCFAGGDPLLPELGRRDEYRKHRSIELLAKLYDLPEPETVVEKVWPHDYWTRGSYMIMAPGDMAAFGKSLGNSFGKVHLAGAEGVAAAPSFMNSAVKAGRRAAEAVADALANMEHRVS